MTLDCINIRIVDILMVHQTYSSKEVSELLWYLSNPLKIDILKLANGGVNEAYLMKTLNGSRSNISGNLVSLRKKGLITDGPDVNLTKNGKIVYDVILNPVMVMDRNTVPISLGTSSYEQKIPEKTGLEDVKYNKSSKDAKHEQKPKDIVERISKSHDLSEDQTALTRYAVKIGKGGYMDQAEAMKEMGLDIEKDVKKYNVVLDSLIMVGVIKKYVQGEKPMFSINPLEII